MLVARARVNSDLGGSLYSLNISGTFCSHSGLQCFEIMHMLDFYQQKHAEQYRVSAGTLMCHMLLPKLLRCWLILSW